MSKIISYDIELYDELSDKEGVNKSLEALRPSVAAFCTTESDTQFFYDDPYMSKETGKKLVNKMMDLMKLGYVPFTWNGASFDFPLLGYYTGMIEECGEIALNHYDAMLYIVFNKGYFLGLDAALIGAGLETKRHSVTLNDGSELIGFSGAQAPEYWRNKEFSAVKYYLDGDVIQPLRLFDVIMLNGGVRWTSKSGKPMFVKQSHTLVKDLFKLPVPNTSWMENPKPRKDFVSWIPEKILERNGVRI